MPLIQSSWRANSPHHLEPKCGSRPAAFSASTQRTLEGLSPQDHDPDLIPVSSAAFNPRPEGNQKVGYRLPRKCALCIRLILASSRVQVPDFRGQRSEGALWLPPISDFRLLSSIRPLPSSPPPRHRAARRRSAAAPRESARRGGWRSCSASSTCRPCRLESAVRRSRSP
jgi:hypothetical protein